MLDPDQYRETPMSPGTNSQSNAMGQPINAGNRDDLSLLDITGSLYLDNDGG
jgi:hypothetical protein